MQLSFLKVCHAQTCGKCVPCRIGLGVLEDMLEDVLDGKATLETLSLIERTAKAIYDSADCAIGYEAGRMVLKGLEGFREDFIEHITNGHCSCHLEQPVPCVALCPAGVDVPGYISLIVDARVLRGMSVETAGTQFKAKGRFGHNDPHEDRDQAGDPKAAVCLRIRKEDVHP